VLVAKIGFNLGFSEWQKFLRPNNQCWVAFPVLATFGARFPGPGCVATQFALSAALSFSFVLALLYLVPIDASKEGCRLEWATDLKGVTNALVPFMLPSTAIL